MNSGGFTSFSLSNLSAWLGSRASRTWPQSIDPSRLLSLDAEYGGSRHFLGFLEVHEKRFLSRRDEVRGSINGLRIIIEVGGVGAIRKGRNKRCLQLPHQHSIPVESALTPTM